MRIKVFGDPEEVKKNAHEIVNRLAKSLGVRLEGLEKASLKKEEGLKHPTLVHMHKRSEKDYRSTLSSMLSEIGKVLDGSLEKSEPFDHSKVQLELDAGKYKAAKEAVMSLGYKTSDFEPGGQFHGASTNELVDLFRENKKA